MAEKVGVPTGQTTEAGRPVFKTPEGELISEKSITIPMGGKFINVPSIHDGVRYSEDEIIDMLKGNKIEATSVHDSMEEAIEAAKSRSSKLLAKGGSMESQMKMFEEGGLYQEGGTTDPVSGNEVPTGSLQEEVRDDIDAKLSEGEFVFPADVVRYIGLENLMKLRQKAKEGLSKMDDMGQMGNSEEAVVDDDKEYDAEVDELIDSFDPNAPDEMEFAEGGTVPNTPQAPQYNIPAGFQQPQYRAPTVPTYESLMGGTSPLPKYETRQYIGPNNDIISITFLNGQPVNPIPEGYRPYKGELVKPKVQAPTVVEDRGGDGKTREEEQEEKQRQADFKMTADVLARNNPTFAAKWTEDPFNTGKFTGLTDVFKSIDTALSMTGAIEQIAKEQDIDLGLYENTGLSRLGGKYDSVSFAKSLAMDEEDLYRGKLNEGLKEDSDRATRAAQVREDFRAREEAEEAAFREGRTGRQTPSSVSTSTPKGVSVSIESAGKGRSSGIPEYRADDAVRRRESDEKDDGGRDGNQGDVTGASEGFGSDGNYGFAKGGLLAPRTPRKPKAKQTTSTRGKGLARKK
jgi:hypothetical protein